MPRHLPWLGIADGAMAAAVVWRLGFSDEPHHFIDVATAFALFIGFLGAVPVALRSLSGFREPPARVLWITFVAYGVLMIALMWRWAVVGEPYSIFGAVTLSVLMLGFLRDTAITVDNLGRSTQPRLNNEQSDGLLLFPTEDPTANDLGFAPRRLATRR